MKFTLATLAAAITCVSAHATFQQLWVSGSDKGGVCVNTPTTNSPVTDVQSASVACNIHNQASTTCSIPAGATVDVEMHQQPGDRACGTEAIGGNHDGPVIIYMAKVDDALSANPNTAKWFKVYENGLVRTDYWGTDVMNANCGRVPFVVPSCLAPGDYLIRAEVIALHVAGGVGGAQLYMSCYPVKVTGSGTVVPANTVSFPGAYSATDPGILFNLYGSYTSYTIPGPAVFKCGSSPVTTPPPVNTSTRTSSTRASTSTTRTGTGASLYGQCGGQGWTGPTWCAQGTCTVVNAFYHQCLP